MQEIVFYHSAMAGAPTSTLNTAGALLAVLDACLVNGVNSISVSMLTQSGGTATATTASSHNFSVGEWIELAGADQSAYNARVKVLTKPAANQFTFAIAAGTASPATGTITARHPPAGWIKSALGTNIAGYQGGAGSLGLWMQVEDNNPYADSHASVRTRLAQGLTALDTASVLGTQYKISKPTGGWLIVADKRSCYLFLGALGGTLKTFCFGEYAPFYGADQFAAFQTIGASGASNNIYDESGASVSGIGSEYWPVVRNLGAEQNAQLLSGLRGVSQIGGPVVLGHNGVMGSLLIPNSSLSWNPWYVWNQLLQVPNPADNSIPVSPLFCNEYVSPNLALRGRFRGIYMPLGRLGSGFVNSFQRLDNATIDGVVQSLLLVNTGLLSRQVAFQVDGAWA